MQPADKVIQLNKWIKEYADKNGLTYVDYHSAMKDERNGLPANLSKDGVHPTLEGYKIMEKTGNVIGVKAVELEHEVMLINTEGIGFILLYGLIELYAGESF